MTKQYDVFGNAFAYNIFMDRYSLDRKETWSDTCKRVVSSVCSQLDKDEQEEVYKIMYNRWFIPGGRYLHSSGREYHQCFNCYAFRAEDSREGWGDLLHKIAVATMSGGGCGVDYSALREEGALIKKTGGRSSGPLSLVHAVNEAARFIRNGGDRRAALWAGLSWKHPDIYKFMDLKNISEAVQIMKSTDSNFPVPMELTNISTIYDTDFFVAIENHKHPEHNKAKQIWDKNCLNSFSTGEPGFSFNFGKDNESLRNACQPSFAKFLKQEGIVEFKDVNVGDKIWAGDRWTNVIRKWSNGIKPVYKFSFTGGTFIGTEDHKIPLKDGNKIEVKDAKYITIWSGPNAWQPKQIDQQDVMDGLVIGDGGVHKASGNLVGLYIGKKDTDYFNDSINTYILKYRPGISTGFYEVKTTIKYNELPKTYERYIPDRFYYGSLEKKCGFLRGLFSANGNSLKTRICLKQSSRKLIEQVQEILNSIGISSYITTNKKNQIKFSNGTYESKESYDINISANNRDRFFDIVGFIQKYKTCKPKRKRTMKYGLSKLTKKEFLGEYEVFNITVDDPEHVYWTGGCLVSNCCEYTTEDDSDSCNLGTIWLNSIPNKTELKKTIKLATKFLICGGLYSDIPSQRMREVRMKNNNIGLGLGGIHEWLIERGYDYECPPELHKWLRTYEEESTAEAYMFSKQLNIAVPKHVRAVAPTGTISALAGTSSGIEPCYCKAYKRRYRKGNDYVYQYVVDGTIKRMMDKGIDVSKIKDAYEIPFKQRIKFQADVQNYIDMGISSTINMHPWGSEKNNKDTLKDYSDILLKYARKLRGFTTYPDGSRSGQPLERVSLEEALKNEGRIFEDKDSCKSGVCGA